MDNTFVFSRELRTLPDCEVFAQVRAPGGSDDYVLAVHDVSRTGALIELSDLAPPWLSAGQEVEFTVIAEGEGSSAEFRGPITRVVEDGQLRGFAVRLDKPGWRARKYLKRLMSAGRPVRETSVGLPD